MCYRNGGGAFLIPYFLFLFLAGIPLFFLELNLGQFTSQGAAGCWKMAPIFKGLGISMNCASALLCIYYNMIIAYSIYFLFLSFRGTLEWSVCDFAWSSRNCTDDFTSFLISCDQPEVVRDPNGVCYNYSGVAGATPIGWWNMEKRIEFKKPVLPSEDFFNNYVLQKSTTIENGGTIVWQLALCLLASWVITFLCIFKGIKSSGKVNIEPTTKMIALFYFFKKFRLYTSRPSFHLSSCLFWAFLVGPYPALVKVSPITSIQI